MTINTNTASVTQNKHLHVRVQMHDTKIVLNKSSTGKTTCGWRITRGGCSVDVWLRKAAIEQIVAHMGSATEGIISEATLVAAHREEILGGRAGNFQPAVLIAPEGVNAAAAAATTEWAVNCPESFMVDFAGARSFCVKGVKAYSTREFAEQAVREYAQLARFISACTAEDKEEAFTVYPIVKGAGALTELLKRITPIAPVKPE